MMHIDQYGLAFTTESPEAATAYVEGLDLLLGNRVGAAQRLQRALELDPTFAVARATLVVLQRPQRDSRAHLGHVLLAARDAKRTSRRERQFVDALRRVMAGHAVEACHLISTHLDEFPRDVVLLRVHVGLQNFGGGARRKEAIAAQLERLAPHFGADPWFLGMYSFALSEVGDLTTAIQLAELGLATRPDHSVLAHAMAHTYFERGDDVGGRSLVDGWLRDHGDSVLNVGHMRWHLALTNLALSDPARALTLYNDQKSVEKWKSFTLEDAISLLWRLQLRGLDVRGEWSSVLQQEPEAAITGPFALAHVAFALAATQDDEGLQHLATEVREEMDAHPDQPFRLLQPLIAALRLVARDQWAEAAPELEAAADGFRRLGGSNEQHALIDETIAYANKQRVS